MDISASIEELKTILSSEDILGSEKRIKEIRKQLKDFESSLKVEESDSEKEEVEETASSDETKSEDVQVEPVPAIDPGLLESINTLLNHCKSKIDELKKAKQASEKANLDAKKKVLEEFRDLIQNEENIKNAFDRIKQIREDWKAIGDIPRDKYQDIQNEYSKLSETFSYNIGIYKELKEHDLKTNFSLKNQVVHKITDLSKINDIKTVEKELSNLRNEWDEIGGTYKDKWEIIKEKYWEAVRSTYDRINAHYQDQKKIQAENLEAKKAVLAKAKELEFDGVDSVKVWKLLTDKVLGLQKEWKKIGFSPRKETQVVWNEFRGVCNAFFDSKQAYYDKKISKDNVNKDRKAELVEKANQLKDSKDWRETTQAIINLQKQWKKIGHAGPHAENKLWKDFRGACDHFFNAKDAHYSKLEDVFKENLKAKEAFIAKIPSIEFPADVDGFLAKLSEVGEEFNKLGDTPSKKTKQLMDAYSKAIQEQVNKLDIPEEEKEHLLFKSKVESVSDAGDERVISDMKNAIRRDIQRLEEDIRKKETNLGFFNVSKGAESLLAGVTKEIEEDKKKVEQLKNKLKIINVALRK